MTELPIEVDCETLRARRVAGEAVVLVDCREPDEHATGVIGGALLMPMGDIPGRLQELQAQSAVNVIVYCHLGGRSLRVARWLRAQGFAQAQSLAGGIERWEELGYRL